MVLPSPNTSVCALSSPTRVMVAVVANRVVENAVVVPAGDRAAEGATSVLLMEFIGKNGVAAPRLKDAEIDVDAAHVAYLDCVRLMCELLIDTTVLVLTKCRWHNHDCS